MKDKINQLINDRLWPLTDPITFPKGSVNYQVCIMYNEQETHNRELLASLIELLIESEEIARLNFMMSTDEWLFSERENIKLIEKTISLSWSEIVKRLEA